MLSNENEYVNLKNHGFSVLNNMFMEHGWKPIKNEFEWIAYTKVGNETDVFQLMVEKDVIIVSIPVKNSPYQYRTIFNTYWEAVEYVEKRFNEFIN
jgi:hypothetical protein